MAAKERKTTELDLVPVTGMQFSFALSALEGRYRNDPGSAFCYRMAAPFTLEGQIDVPQSG
jgi:hypothetical protein